MQKLITTLIVILSFIVFGALAIAIFVTIKEIASPSNTRALLDKLILLPGIAISSGVLVAIITYARERNKQIIEQERHTSELMLSKVKDGFDTVIDLLSDQNNNRVTWVRAARTLLKAVNLKQKITSEEFKVAYDLEEERARNELYGILSIKNEHTGERNPLPPQFFYGIEDWKKCKSIDDAAIKASTSAVVYSPTLDEVPPQPYLKPLSVKSVIAIFDFMEYPDTYSEPLKEVKEWSDNWQDSHGMDQGARRYVEHTNQKHAAGGKLYDRSKKSSN